MRRAVRRSSIALAVALAAGAAAIVPSTATAACAVVDDPTARLVARKADTILVARVVGPGNGEDRTRLRVLTVYRGSADRTIEVDDSAVSCYYLPNHVGRRVLLAFGRTDRWGDFTVGWFEYRIGWQQFGSSYPTLGSLLRAVGVAGDLPDTAAPSPRPADGTAPLLAVLFGATALTAGLRLRVRSRLPA